MTVLTAAACSTAPGAENTITMVTYGGEMVEPMKDAFAGPVEKADPSIRVVQDSPTDYAKLKAMQKAGNVTWNVVDAEPYVTAGNCGKMFQKLSGVDRSHIDPRFVTDECSVPANTYSMVLAYDRSKFGDDPPTTWADFFNTSKYPGKRALWNYVGGNALEMALLGDGVAKDDLYPLDTKRAYKKLSGIKKDLTFYSSLSQSTEMLLNGQVSMVATANARAQRAAEVDPDKIGVNWNQALLSWEAWAVPTGASNKAASMKLLNQIAKPEAQTALAATYPLGPTVRNPDLGDVPKALRPWLPSEPSRLKQAVIIDPKYYADHFDQLSTEFTEFQSN